MANPHINDFIQSLNTEETKIVNEYFHRLYSGENKIKKLFEILTADRNRKYTDKELSVLLKNDEGAIRVLKSRLFNCVKEALVQDKHFENDVIFSEREKLVFILKKKILFIKSVNINQTQDKVGTIIALLNEIVISAKKNEIYDVLQEALILKKAINSVRKGYAAYEKIKKEINFYNTCFMAVQNAADDFFNLTLNTSLAKSYTANETKKVILNSISRMEQDFKITKSQEVYYFLQMFKAAAFDNEKKIPEAIACFQKILLLLKKSTVLFNKNRIGFATINLSHFYTKTGNYSQAIKYAKEAKKFHHQNSISHLIVQEQEFYVNFYADNLTESIKCLNKMMRYPFTDAGFYRKSKFIYFKACVQFKNKNYKNTLQLLLQPFEIEKDKSGWNIGLRQLLIMTFIELGKITEAMSALNTLRKYLERTSKAKEINPRDILIFKLLRELEKDDFKRNEKNKTVKKLLTELSDKNKPTAWSHFTPEMIPFHEWVMTLPVKNT